jgi:hypothetical protein
VATFIAAGMAIRKGIDEESNGISRNEALKRKPWVKRIGQMGTGSKQLLWAQDRVSTSMKVEFLVAPEIC